MVRSPIVLVQIKVATTITLSHTSTEPGAPGEYVVKLDGVLTRNDTGTGVEGKPIYIWALSPGGTWTRTPIAVATTRVDGSYTVTSNLVTLGEWQFQTEFLGDTEFSGCD